jgi:hypothetical protein
VEIAQRELEGEAVAMVALTPWQRRTRFALGFGVTLAALLAAWIYTGVPLAWGKGVVVANSCSGATNSYVCEVETVPEGLRVPVRSGIVVPGGEWVELRRWHNPITGTDTFTMVR